MARGNYKLEELRREERRKTVAANILAGLNVSEIAAALSVARKTVYNDVQLLMTRWQADQVTLVTTQKLLDARRIDRLLNVLWKDAQEGNLTVVDRVLRLLERRAKLLGLDAPQKLAPTTPEGDEAYDPLAPVRELDALLARMGERLDSDAIPSGTPGTAAD